MKKFMLPLLALLMAGCVSNVEDADFTNIPVTDALVILDADVRFDGDRQDSCFLNPDPTKYPGLDVVAKDTYRTRIVRIPNGGLFGLESAQCIENKVLWVKNRRKVINPPLQVYLQPGTITYPGTVVADWESEGFGLSDAILSAGALLEDEGSLVMKREDRSAQMIALLNSKNPHILGKFRFVNTTFNPNPLIVQ